MSDVKVVPPTRVGVEREANGEPARRAAKGQGKAFFEWLREAAAYGQGDGETPLRGGHARRALDVCEALWPGWEVERVVTRKAAKYGRSLVAIGRDGDQRLVKQRDAVDAAREGRVRWVSLKAEVAPDKDRMPNDGLARYDAMRWRKDLVQRRQELQRSHLDEQLQARCTEADEALIEALTIARRLAREGRDDQAMRLYALLKDAAWSVGEIEDLLLGDVVNRHGDVVVRSGEDLTGRKASDVGFQRRVRHTS